MTTKEINDRAKENGLHPNTVKYRLKKGEPLESAISRPQRQGRVATKPRVVKGEKLAKYNLNGKLLTLSEIAAQFNINYSSLYVQVVKRKKDVCGVVERLSETTTADGILRLIDALPIAERNKLSRILSNIITDEQNPPLQSHHQHTKTGDELER